MAAVRASRLALAHARRIWLRAQGLRTVETTAAAAEEWGRHVNEVANATLEKHGLGISSLAYYPNNLHRDDAHREDVNAHLRKVVDAAKAAA